MGDEDEHHTTNHDPIEKCNSWLEKCSVNACETESCSTEYSTSTDLTTSSEQTNNSALDNGFSFVTNGAILGNLVIERKDSISHNYHVAEWIDQNTSKLPKHGNIQIYKSKKVHIGDVNYIQAPIYMNDKAIASASENIQKPEIASVTPLAPFHIIERRCWLAQPRVDINYMEKPANHVIICHSATEDAMTIAENTLLVRLIQSFHIDSRKWWDIGYNFLIGAEGSVYEGRGWNVIGSHTSQYNSTSVGICFIGTFIRKLPTANALKKAQQLIEHGISIGAIDEKFSLLAHCQCSGTESPGEALYKEIQTWKNYNPSISVKNPSFLLPSLKNPIETNMP